LESVVAVLSFEPLGLVGVLVGVERVGPMIPARLV